MDRRKQLIVFLIPLLSALVFASAQDDSPPCDPILLARMAASCVGYLVEPPEECCQMVVAAVGLGYGDPVPCLCRVVKEPDFPATRLNIDMILKMYPICDGVRPVGPYAAAICR